MIFAALAIIIAILLFGAGAVKGFISGTVAFLGSAAVVGAVAYLIARAFDLNGLQVFFYLVVGAAALLFGSTVIFALVCAVLGIDPATGEKRR